MRFDKWCPELEALLSEPFPPEQFSKKRVQGNDIHFVSWHHYVRRLNDLVGPGWSIGTPIVTKTDPYQKWVKAKEGRPEGWLTMPARLVFIVPLTILGVTRCNSGDESEGKDDYGTAPTNAFAQGLKRSAALFGMGLDMYDKEARIKLMAGEKGGKKKVVTGDGLATASQKAEIVKLLAEKQLTERQSERINNSLATHITVEEATELVAWLGRRPALA